MWWAIPATFVKLNDQGEYYAMWEAPDHLTKNNIASGQYYCADGDKEFSDSKYNNRK